MRAGIVMRRAVYSHTTNLCWIKANREGRGGEGHRQGSQGRDGRVEAVRGKDKAFGG